MKWTASFCLALYMTTAVAMAAVSVDDNDAVEMAKGIAHKFLDAVDRKRPDVAGRLSYIIKREKARGAIERVPLVSEHMLKIRIDAREKFGKLLSRDLVQTSVVKSHHNLPDSRFVEFRYELRFQKKEKISEVVKIKAEGEQKGKVVSFSSS